MKTFARRERRATDIAASISSSQGWGSGGSSQGTFSSSQSGSQSQDQDPYSFPPDIKDQLQESSAPLELAKKSGCFEPSRFQPAASAQHAPTRHSGASRRVCFQKDVEQEQLVPSLKRQARVSLMAKHFI